MTAIAEFLIIMDLERMPPKSLLAQALQEYKRDDISTEQMKSLLELMTTNSLRFHNVSSLKVSWSGMRSVSL